MEPITPAPYQRLSLVLIALFLSLAAGRASEAQVRVVANLPDAPMPKQPPNDDQQKSNNTHSTYDILSRRSFFFPDLAFTTKPLSTGQKFLLAADESAADIKFVGLVDFEGRAHVMTTDGYQLG